MVRLWPLIAAASVVVATGLIGVGYAVRRWTAPPLHCRYGGHLPAGRPLPPCLIIPVKESGPTAWTAFGVGLASLAVGVCLILLASRVKRERSVRLALG
jgi:hypothetical protein